MDPALWELLEEGEKEDEVAAIIRLAQPGNVPPQVRVIAQFREIITVRMQRGSILDIREDAQVSSFKAPGPSMGPEVELEDAEVLETLPEAIQPGDERRPESLQATGYGVIVGIVDWGFDFVHADFRNADGSTRILALWDQRGRSRPESPQPYGYGIVHTRESIDRALTAGDPYITLGYDPADADLGQGTHGTLVASIAAGNGTGGGPAGVAPEAELVFVHLATWGEDRSAKLGNSVTILEAIDFIARTAGDRPWVINLSMGRTGEQHDGTTLVEQGLDAILRAAPGRVICQSTGNYFQRRLHASGQLRPSEERTLLWEVSQIDTTPNELEIWYPGRDKMTLEIHAPQGLISVRLGLGERAPLLLNNQTVGRVYHRAIEPNSLDNHIDIYLYTNAPPGIWQVTLIATDVVDGRYHAWIERDAACRGCQSHFLLDDVDPTSTTGTICNGQRTIAVGAYDPHQPDEPVAPFSSMGPTRDGRLKPDLCAPGVGILGARSAPRKNRSTAPLLTRMSGTSFAAPHVTGCVALMLQAAPRPLRIEEIHNLLLASTRKPVLSEDIPGRIGGGYLDIEKAVEAVERISRIGPELISVSRVKEAAMKQEDQELLGELLEETYIEGKAEDESDQEEAQTPENTFHRIASDITGTFEGGKPGTLNLYDRGIISYGKHQATLASGTLYFILKRFTELSSSETARKLSSYLERVNQRDESLREDQDFIQLLKIAANEPAMSQAQDQEFARQYWEPSKKAAKEAGIKTALGYAILYDTRIQGGLQQVLKKTQQRTGGKVGDSVGGSQITEQDFLRVFMEERIKRNLQISAMQKKQAETLIKEADSLEEQAASSTDSGLANELRLQAGDKRKRAKQFAANAAALEVSANKTRGPSLAGLVDSGDLDLHGDAEGRIYLKGKPGVVIRGLKPGAAIDNTSSMGESMEEEEFEEEAAPKHNLILISGGPGPYDNRDIEHDQSWANYVTPPLLLTDTEAKRKAFVTEEEEVWWFVYKPAYERRWTEDSNSSSDVRKKAVKDVQKRGYTSYVDLIEGRARERGWNLRWLNEADDLWKKLKTFSKNSITRVWYWGHARDDLWLSVSHDPDTGTAMSPDPDEIILISSIDSSLKNRFRKGDVDRMSRFIGCNTSRFAEAWAKTFKVWAEGVDGKVNFASIHRTGGEPCLAGAAAVKFFSPSGKEEPGEAWRARAVKCGAGTSGATHELETIESIEGQAFPFVAEDLPLNETDEFQAETLMASETEVLQTPKIETLELVELADQIIAERTISSAPSMLLNEALSRAGVVETLNLPGSMHLPSAAEIFDAFAYPGSNALRSHLEQYFEVVAPPRSRLVSELKPGDLIVRRAEGGLGHVSIVATGEVLRAEELAAAGLHPESRQPGPYAQIVELGEVPHRIQDGFARRVAGEDGRLSYDQMILRPVSEVFVPGVVEAVEPEAGLAEAIYSSVECFAPPIEFARTVVTFETHTSALAPTTLVTDSISTAADLRARPQRMIVQDAAGNAFAVRAGKAAFASPFYRDSGGHIEIALESLICYPADPRDSSKLPQSRRPFPVALVVHGNHEAATFNVTPDGNSVTDGVNVFLTGEPTSAAGTINSHLGYRYLQEELARHGIVSMSVNHNAANLLDLLLTTRGVLNLHYLDQLRRMSEDRSSRFFNKLDFSRVALIGHSRGGDAVIKTVSLNASRSHNQFGIRAVVAISPTDVTGVLPEAERLKITTGRGEHFLVVYGSHDSDVSGFCGANEAFGTGFRHYDRSSAHRAMAFIHGASHNGFNREWPIETTGAVVLSRAQQEALAQEYVGGWLRMILNAEWSQQDLFNGNLTNSLSRPVSLQWKFGRDLKTIDRFGDTDETHNTMGGGITKPTYTHEVIIATEGARNFPHQDRVLRAEASSGGRSPYRTIIPSAHKDFSDFNLLTFRITKKYPLTNQAAIDSARLPEFDITLEDERGQRKTMTAAAVQRHNTQATRPIFRMMTDIDCATNSTAAKNITKNNLETWKIPLSFFGGDRGIDLAAVRAIEFDFNAVTGEPLYLDTFSLVKT